LVNGGAENPPGVPGDSSLSVYLKVSCSALEDSSSNLQIRTCRKQDPLGRTLQAFSGQIEESATTKNSLDLNMPETFNLAGDCFESHGMFGTVARSPSLISASWMASA
jgi:hypothetical protein